MNDILKLRKSTYNLRNANLFETQNPRTKRYGRDCIVYRASKIWQTAPIQIRDSILLKIFKHKVNHCVVIRVHVTAANFAFTTYLYKCNHDMAGLILENKGMRAV